MENPYKGSRKLDRWWESILWGRPSTPVLPFQPLNPALGLVPQPRPWVWAGSSAGSPVYNTVSSLYLVPLVRTCPQLPRLAEPKAHPHPLQRELRTTCVKWSNLADARSPAPTLRGRERKWRKRFSLSFWHRVCVSQSDSTFVGVSPIPAWWGLHEREGPELDEGVQEQVYPRRLQGPPWGGLARSARVCWDRGSSRSSCDLEIAPVIGWTELGDASRESPPGLSTRSLPLFRSLKSQVCSFFYEHGKISTFMITRRRGGLSNLAGTADIHVLMG